ncbi:MAG: hypothetical protein HQM09_05025 [Candidatus Riflebacteria bacterium]|nr:hypothetical protein [Candidatus Riflebacteria bacterium]
MNTPARFVLLASICVCLIFTIMYVFEPVPVQKIPEWTPSFIQVPNYPADPAELASAAVKVMDPFRPRFFENARFKGITHSQAGGFSAVFLDGSNRIVQLASGQTLDGITIQDISGNKCRVLIGSASKEIVVQNR